MTCRFRVSCALALVCLLAETSVKAQKFNSGSTGSDGALTLTTPGTVVLDPTLLGLDPDGDNVFHFTTITIGAGVTLQLKNAPLKGKPVVWLASESVQVSGIIDLSGQPGYSSTDPLPVSRRPAEPGPGGFPGGVGFFGSSPPQPGSGPGGGPTGCDAAHLTASGCGGAIPYGNAVLVPLRGGSGGGGNNNPNPLSSAGGGGGGGALRIASSVSISLTGGISANGGDAGASTNNPGAGSGGAIHLIAPVVSGGGFLAALGGKLGGSERGSRGRIRVDAFQHQFTGCGPCTFGTPYSVPLPTAQPTVRVTSIGGVTIPSNPSGSFSTPDVILNQTGPVTVNIEARNIPIGTIVKLHLFSEVAPDQILDSSPLAGASVTLTTATVSATFAPGFSRGFARATW